MKSRITVTWRSTALRKPETLSEGFRRTKEYCPACGQQGTWANGDGSRFICVACGTVERRSEPLAKASDFWTTILQQLRRAQGAAA